MLVGLRPPNEAFLMSPACRDISSIGPATPAFGPSPSAPGGGLRAVLDRRE